MRQQQADLHFHALPGLDDGPATIEESIALIRAAQAEGTTRVVATPHVRWDFVTDISDQSITGAHGFEARTAALKLVREGLVTIVGSDAHGPTRPPLLGLAHRTLSERGVDVNTCRALTVSGPLWLLARGLAPGREREPALAG